MIISNKRIINFTHVHAAVRLRSTGCHCDASTPPRGRKCVSGPCDQRTVELTV